MTGLRHLLVGSERSIGQRSRRRRAEQLLEFFPDLSDMTVLDLGGGADFWDRSLVRPARVVGLNPEVRSTEDFDWYTHVVGDACDPPDEVRAMSFDLVFSNSTIEHVGGIERRQRFASAVRSIAPAHWVQTPNRYFPVEPHFLFPGFQFLPARARARIVRHWPLVHTRSEDPGEALEVVLYTELLGAAEMTLLFPDSTITAERFLGLTKSLIAVRNGSAT